MKRGRKPVVWTPHVGEAVRVDIGERRVVTLRLIDGRLLAISSGQVLRRTHGEAISHGGTVTLPVSCLGEVERAIRKLLKKRSGAASRS